MCMRIFSLLLILEVRPSVLLSLEFERGMIVHRNLWLQMFSQQLILKSTVCGCLHVHWCVTGGYKGHAAGGG